VKAALPSHSGGDPYINKEIQAPNMKEATKITMERRTAPPCHPNSIAKAAPFILALFTGVRGRRILRSSRRRRAAGIMQQQGKPQARRTPFMSIFPTKVIVATDGSEETL
jgi:hypothetical protein